MQFLIESGTMALVGGVVGVLFGIAVAKGVTAVIGMPSAIKLWAVAAGLIVSLAAGETEGLAATTAAATADDGEAVEDGFGEAAGVGDASSQFTKLDVGVDPFFSRLPPRSPKMCS